MAKYRPIRDFEPVHIIMESSAYNIAPYTARTALLHILTHWWVAGCPELKGVSYMAMSGLRECDWQRHKEFVVKGLEEIMPDLRELHVIITRKRNAIKAIAQMGRDKAKKNREETLAQSVAKIQLSDKPMHSGVVSSHKLSNSTTPKPFVYQQLSKSGEGLTESRVPLTKPTQTYTTEHLPD